VGYDWSFYDGGIFPPEGSPNFVVRSYDDLKPAQ